MAESAYQHQLKRRREQLWLSLSALSQNRADAYRLNGAALALGRTGVKYQDPQEKARLGAAEITADDAMRDAQREIRQLDEQIVRSSDLTLRSKAERGLQRVRASRAGRIAIRFERGLHRYCSGCAWETEHVLCQEGDEASIPAIRRPAVKAVSGTTICVDCGQWRAAASL